MTLDKSVDPGGLYFLKENISFLCVERWNKLKVMYSIAQPKDHCNCDRKYCHPVPTIMPH